MEYRESSVSGSVFEMSIPPKVIVPLFTSQKRAASLETVLCDGFPFVGVWTMEKTHPFVCLEPWYGVCDSKDFTGELKDRQGIQNLKAWESWEKGYRIRIE